MNEEITNKGKMANDGSDTFFQLYTVSLKKLGEFFSHTYSIFVKSYKYLVTKSYK